MNKEQLLEEAKRRYPIGTKVKSLYYGNIYYGNILMYNCGITPTTDQIWVGGENLNNYLIYERNKWAEIISYPENYKPINKLFKIY